MNKQEVTNYLMNNTLNPAVIGSVLDSLTDSLITPPAENEVIYDISEGESNTAQLPEGVTVQTLIDDLANGKNVSLRVENEDFILKYTNTSNDRLMFSYTIGPTQTKLVYTNIQATFYTKDASNTTHGKWLESTVGL